MNDAIDRVHGRGLRKLMFGAAAQAGDVASVTEKYQQESQQQEDRLETLHFGEWFRLQQQMQPHKRGCRRHRSERHIPQSANKDKEDDQGTESGQREEDRDHAGSSRHAFAAAKAEPNWKHVSE